MTTPEIHNQKTQQAREIIEHCEYNLFAFAQLLNPYYVYGDIHQEVFSWLSDPKGPDRRLLLLPRGHLKSHCIAVFCTWKITYQPWITLVYLASQEDLAKAQVYAIKSMMTSDIYTALWPEMFAERKGERGVWSAYAFDVDHPGRKERSVRDHTLIIKTVKSNSQGLHCDGLLLDDVVVPQYADSATGRAEVARSLGYFASILNPGGWIIGAGTRYHPKDAYQAMIDARQGVWDPIQGAFTKEVPLWDVKEKVVEDSPDRSGTGAFLWPRTVSAKDGKSYGFDIQELSKIRADYQSHSGTTHFYSQYYNDPNDVGAQRIKRDWFQYYDRKFVTVTDNTVKYKGNRLNVYAAMDVAWSNADSADYTAIAVVGIDSEGFIYVLDTVRFRTSSFNEYYETCVQLQQHWGFRKMAVETNAGGALVAQEIESLVRRNGGNLVVDRRVTNHKAGTKQERWASVLEPRYESKTVWHAKGGLTPVLEEELMSAKPAHDDLKDALCVAISIAKPPVARKIDYKEFNNTNVIQGKFGGRIRIR